MSRWTFWPWFREACIDWYVPHGSDIQRLNPLHLGFLHSRIRAWFPPQNIHCGRTRDTPPLAMEFLYVSSTSSTRCLSSPDEWFAVLTLTRRSHSLVQIVLRTSTLVTWISTVSHARFLYLIRWKMQEGTPMMTMTTSPRVGRVSGAWGGEGKEGRVWVRLLHQSELRDICCIIISSSLTRCRLPLKHILVEVH